jgi:quinol monooxygenase YgiN
MQIPPTRRSVLMAAVVVSSAAQPSDAQSTKDYFYVVAHVDVPPPNLQKTLVLLKQFSADTRKDPGLVRLDIQQEAAMPNHFAIVSVWKDRAAFEANQGSEATKRFREGLYPLLGAPLDMRPGHLIE